MSPMSTDNYFILLRQTSGSAPAGSPAEWALQTKGLGEADPAAVNIFRPTGKMRNSLPAECISSCCQAEHHRGREIPRALNFMAGNAGKNGHVFALTFPGQREAFLLY